MHFAMILIVLAILILMILRALIAVIRWLGFRACFYAACAVAVVLAIEHAPPPARPLCQSYACKVARADSERQAQVDARRIAAQQQPVHNL